MKGLAKKIARSVNAIARELARPPVAADKGDERLPKLGLALGGFARLTHASEPGTFGAVPPCGMETAD